MITLHVLAQSRALRIVWLLELIGAPYQIKTYARHLETLLAPDELKAVHPLGKSPVIDDDGFVLNESGAITDYLIQTYGGGCLMPERDSQDYWHYQRWLHYAEGSLMPLLLRILRMAESWRRLTGRGLGMSNICAPQAESLSSSSSSRIR